MPFSPLAKVAWLFKFGAERRERAVRRKALRGSPSAPLLLYLVFYTGWGYLSTGFSAAGGFLQGERKGFRMVRVFLWKNSRSVQRQERSKALANVPVSRKKAVDKFPPAYYNPNLKTRAFGFSAWGGSALFYIMGGAFGRSPLWREKFCPRVGMVCENGRNIKSSCLFSPHRV